MEEKKKRRNELKEITEIVKQLDENSLLLMISGAKLLLTRQQMDNSKGAEKELIYK